MLKGNYVVDPLVCKNLLQRMRMWDREGEVMNGGILEVAGITTLCDSQSCAADYMDQTKSNKIRHECNVYSFCSLLFH